MYRSVAMCLILLQGGWTSQVHANEVGNKNWVNEPKAPPIFVSKGGTRFWPCEGMVNPKLIQIAHDEMSQIANAEKLQPPDRNLCAWKRGKFNFAGNSIDTYEIQFYVDRSSYNACTALDNCQETRLLTFKAVNGEPHRQYMLTSAPKRLTKMVCISMQGKIVNFNGGC